QHHHTLDSCPLQIGKRFLARLSDLICHSNDPKEVVTRADDHGRFPFLLKAAHLLLDGLGRYSLFFKQAKIANVDGLTSHTTRGPTPSNGAEVLSRIGSDTSFLRLPNDGQSE